MILQLLLLLLLPVVLQIVVAVVAVVDVPIIAVDAFITPTPAVEVATRSRIGGNCFLRDISPALTTILLRRDQPETHTLNSYTCGGRPNICVLIESYGTERYGKVQKGTERYGKVRNRTRSLEGFPNSSKPL